MTNIFSHIWHVRLHGVNSGPGHENMTRFREFTQTLSRKQEHLKTGLSIYQFQHTSSDATNLSKWYSVVKFQDVKLLRVKKYYTYVTHPELLVWQPIYMFITLCGLQSTIMELEFINNEYRGITRRVTKNLSEPLGLRSTYGCKWSLLAQRG